MTVETRVLVGGQWTTRTMDIHQILAQNREEANAQGPSSPGEVARSPTTAGILTRTLLRSPVVNWILPARIRDTYKNDVLFIGQDFVGIKRLFCDSHLEDVAVKSDFGSRICSARVFGTPVTTLEPTGVNATASVTKSDEMDQKEDDSSQLPPQILVLALESQVLVFLYAFGEGPDKIQYVTGRRPLPAQRSYLEQLGKHMAVDPRSRALAVAACQGMLCLYSLKPREQLQEEHSRRRESPHANFMPIREERHFFIDGTILKMEFLQPPHREDNHVILLLIVSRDQVSRYIYYEWDCSTDLRHAEQTGKGYPLRPDDSHPLLLIPLTISSGFMLVCEKVVSVYGDNFLGPPKRNWFTLEHPEPPQDPASSRRLPLWTHWAKPTRHDQYASMNNDIYLCREDGVVLWLEISKASEIGNIMIGNQRTTGVLGCNIDTAFATLDLSSTHCDDHLVCGGDMSNGGLFIVKFGRNGLNGTQTIHNWAPTIDFVTSRVSSSAPGTQRYHPSSDEALTRRERIFACSGRGSNHGAVSELRYGVEARIGTTMAIDEGVLDMWALTTARYDTLLILSYPAATLLLQVPSDLKNRDSEIVLIDGEDMGLRSDDRTITAAVTTGTKVAPPADKTECFIIQIAASSVHVISHVTAQRRWSRQFKEERVVAADICRENAAILIALRHGENMYLTFGIFQMHDEQIKFEEVDHISLPSEPSCVSLQRHGEHYLAFVGTLSGTLQIFHAHVRSAFTPKVEYEFDGNFAICDSIALLQAERTKMVLTCGLRNGSVEILLVRPQEDCGGDFVKSCEKRVIGSTSVRVMQDIHSDHCALLLCGQDICRLSYSSSMPLCSSTTVHNLWLTDQAQPSFQQGEISAVAQVDICSKTEKNRPQITTPSLFCVEGESLHVAAFDTRAAPRAVTRRIAVAGAPSRIIFSERLNMLIVGSVRVEVKPARPPQQPKPKRLFRPMIDLIFPDGDPVEIEDNIDGGIPQHPPRDGFWKPGERIMGLLEWFPKGEGKSYHLLVVNTIIGQADNHTGQGRILILNFVKDENTGKLRLAEKNPSRCDKPVFSVAAYGDSSLVSGRGNELVLRTLRVSDRKWNETVTHKLRSPAISISVKYPFIYVTTARESLSVFTFEEDKFVPQFSDNVARDGLRHLHLPSTGITLASNKTCSVAGLWQPPERPISNSLTTLFEAVLPTCITQLRQCFVRPSWCVPTHSFQGHPKVSSTILGSSADGTLYQFEILNIAKWRLLRFIQNMAMRNPEVCPLTYQGPHRMHIEPSLAKEQYMHVDGDILARIVERSCERRDERRGIILLREMLEVERSAELRFVDFDQPQERLNRFKQLVKEALTVGYGEDPVEVAMVYLTRAVQLVL